MQKINNRFIEQKNKQLFSVWQNYAYKHGMMPAIQLFSSDYP